jgi:hypothetical protein
MGSAWAVCQDIGQRYAAIVASLMNMCGNLGGALAGLCTGFVLQRSLDAHAAHLGFSSALQLGAAEKAIGLAQGYQTSFLIFATVYVLGVVCWLGIDATQPLVPQGDGVTEVPA